MASTTPSRGPSERRGPGGPPPTHDGRAEILVEITYPNGGVTTVALDEEACAASLDRSGVTSIDHLVGLPWRAVLPALSTITATPTHRQS
ncbi:MAG: hypothetical protein ACFCVK_16340 [Acidimicrobiales bacterium]